MWTKMALALALLALLGSVIGVSVPQDVSEDFLQRLQVVVQHVQAGLVFGSYSFALTPTELWPGSKGFVTLQQATPRDGLKFLEQGFPIARLSVEESFPLSGATIAPGNYYLILWISDKRFDRFGISWPPRVPLLLFVTEDRLELVELTIPCKVEVEVPNKNPDKVFSLTMAFAPGACGPGASAADLCGATLSPKDYYGRIFAWGLGTLGGFSDPQLWNTPGVPISIPPEEELFPPQAGPEEEPEPPLPNK